MIKQIIPYTDAELLSTRSQGIHKPTGVVFTVKSRRLTDGIVWIITTNNVWFPLDECEHYDPFGDF